MTLVPRKFPTFEEKFRPRTNKELKEKITELNEDTLKDKVETKKKHK